YCGMPRGLYTIHSRVPSYCLWMQMARFLWPIFPEIKSRFSTMLGCIHPPSARLAAKVVSYAVHRESSQHPMHSSFQTVPTDVFRNSAKPESFYLLSISMKGWENRQV